MCPEIVFICLKYTILYSIGPYFLHVTTLILKLFKYFPRHDNDEKCMILLDMQHSQPYVTFYLEVIFLVWYGRI